LQFKALVSNVSPDDDQLVTWSKHVVIINNWLNVFTFLELRQIEYDNHISYSTSCELVIFGGGMHKD
jgi:hypothetical protein